MIQALGFRMALALSILSLPALGAPRAFDPAKDIEITLQRGVLLMKVPKDVHLKQHFFKVESKGGVVIVGKLPTASSKDELGDPVWRGTIRVPLRGQDMPDPVELIVSYQPCSEGTGGVCYRPQRRTLMVRAADFDSR